VESGRRRTYNTDVAKAIPNRLCIHCHERPPRAGSTRICQDCYGKCRLCGAPTSLIKPGVFRAYCTSCEFYGNGYPYSCYRCGGDRTGRHPIYCVRCVDMEARERERAATSHREPEARGHKRPRSGRLSSMKGPDLTALVSVVDGLVAKSRLKALAGGLS